MAMAATAAALATASNLMLAPSLNLAPGLNNKGHPGSCCAEPNTRRLPARPADHARQPRHRRRPVQRRRDRPPGELPPLRRRRSALRPPGLSPLERLPSASVRVGPALRPPGLSPRPCRIPLAEQARPGCARGIPAAIPLTAGELRGGEGSASVQILPGTCMLAAPLRLRR